MLSILIPVYNFSIVKLVQELHTQATAEQIDFEINLIDDRSTAHFRTLNQSLGSMPSVHYQELDENIGRAKIRNQLASQAHYDHLLFMDCDSEVPSKYYIKNYLLTCTNTQKGVVCGGTTYKQQPPKDKTMHLRWYYGVKREVKTAEIRTTSPYKSFTTHNFMISKSVINKITFSEDIKGYGHEDTLFGLELKRHNINIIHIDNPLIHIGLDPTEHFIKKIKRSIENIYYIHKKHPTTNIAADTELLKFYYSMKNLGLRKPIVILFDAFEQNIESNLKSNKPKMLLLDFYKLGYLSKIDT